MAKKKQTTKSPRRAAPVPEGAREKLIYVSRALFAEHGIEGVSVRDISSKAGLNVSLVSYYFGGKEGLYKAVIEDHAIAPGHLAWSPRIGIRVGVERPWRCYARESVCVSGRRYRV